MGPELYYWQPRYWIKIPLADAAYQHPLGEEGAWTAFVEFDTLAVNTPTGLVAGSAVNANNELPITWTSSGQLTQA